MIIKYRFVSQLLRISESLTEVQIGHVSIVLFFCQYLGIKKKQRRVLSLPGFIAIDIVPSDGSADLLPLAKVRGKRNKVRFRAKTFRVP